MDKLHAAKLENSYKSKILRDALSPLQRNVEKFHMDEESIFKNRYTLKINSSIHAFYPFHMVKKLINSTAPTPDHHYTKINTSKAAE